MVSIPAESIGDIGIGVVTLIIAGAIMVKLALNDILSKIKEK